MNEYRLTKPLPMPNKEPLMRCLLLGMLCAVALGCDRSTPTTSSVNSTTQPSRTITTSRPVIVDGQESTTSSLDHTSTTQLPADAQPRLNEGSNQPLNRDNTGVNERDSDSLAKTPIDQNENKADIATTADIRKRVVDTEMSINAQNVKIITQEGKVTLRGPVQTAEEKQTIEAIAVDVAGQGNVTNQLEVNLK